MSQFAPSYVVWTVLGTLWVALFIPVFVVLGKPLVERFQGDSRWPPLKPTSPRS